MLYTFSQAHYDPQVLATIFQQLTPNDAVLLWQNGVLQAVKNPDFFTKVPRLFVLENDVVARGVNCPFPTISLAELVEVTEQFYPQVAL